MTGREPYPYIAGDRDHRRSRTSRIRASAAASTLASTRTRRPPPRLISITPLRPPAARGCSLLVETAGSVGASEILAAAKRGTTTGGTWFARDCRRQVNSRLAEIPWRRATSDTFAPGASVSSMMRALSSRDQRRRRSRQELQPASVDLKASLKVTRLAGRPNSTRRFSPGGVHCGHHFRTQRQPEFRPLN